jgi:biopolymer transport protein ExbD
MDLRHLRAFAAVADSHSFSKAARQLHVAQPPLSRHIRQLENEIGVKVFLRTTTGVQLTREGTMLAGNQVFANPDAVRPLLTNEEYVLKTQGKSLAAATIVIRAHKDAQTGQVQELIKVAQQVGFEKFTLRAQEQRQ